MNKLYFAIIFTLLTLEAYTQVTTQHSEDFTAPLVSTLDGNTAPEWQVVAVAGNDLLRYSGNTPAGTVTNTAAIDITGLSNLVIELDLSTYCNNVEFFEAAGSDYLRVSYSYDGSSYTTLAEWQGDGDVNMSLETDGIAGGDGTKNLTSTLQTFALAIPAGAGTETTLYVEVEALASTEDEVIEIDNIIVKTYGDTPGPTATITKNDVVSGDKNIATNDDEVSFDITFDRYIDPSTFSIGEITVGGTATTTGASLVNSGDNKTFTFTINPTTEGTVNISIAASVLTDIAGNDNVAAGPSSSFTIDNTAPDPVISTLEPNPTNSSSITITIDFNEDVTGFVSSDIIVTNGTKLNFQDIGSGQFSVDITPTSDGEITANIDASIAQDIAGNNNNAASEFSVNYDGTAPSAVLTSSETDPTNSSIIVIDIDFGETVSGFGVSEIIVTNGTKANFQDLGGGQFSVDVTPAADGEITVNIAAAVAQDNANNDNTAATEFSVTYDITSPTPVITSAETDPTNSTLFTIEINFNEQVVGFTDGDIIVVNGTKSNFQDLGGGQFSVEITPTSDGEITANIAASVAQDLAGNNSSVATEFTIDYDGTAPSVVLTSSESNPTNSSPFTVNIDFGEVVTGFNDGNVIVTNGTKSNFQDLTGGSYSIDITPSAEGEITVNVGAAVAQDNANNDNTAASEFSITYDVSAPTPIITSAETDPTNSSPFTLDIDFNEEVTGFDIGDIIITNGTKSNFQDFGGGQFSVDATPGSDGEITANIAASVAQDLAGNNNSTAIEFTIGYDGTIPTASFSILEDGPQSSFVIAFNEQLSGSSTSITNISNLLSSAVYDPTGENIPIDLTTNPGSVVWDLSSPSTPEATVTFPLMEFAAGKIVRINFINSVIEDPAGNSISSATNVEGTVIDVTPPTVSPDEMSLSGSTTIEFTLSEEINLPEGPVLGFTSSNGSISSVEYSGKGTTNLITVTGSGWSVGATTISYNPGVGNIVDFAGNEMLAINDHVLVINTVNLGAGSIAFTYYRSDDPNQFAFVLLEDVEVGTQIKFTNNGWNEGTQSFRSGEETLIWTADQRYFAGKEILINGSSASSGSTTGSGLTLSTSGDQIFAYQGTAGNPTFLSAIHNNGGWDANNDTDQKSTAPASHLTDGVNMINFSSETDNASYERNVMTGSANSIRTSINTNTNWDQENNTSNLNPVPTDGYNYTLPPDVVSFSPSNGSIINDDLSTLTITFDDNLSNFDVSTGSDILLKLDDGTIVGTFNVSTPAVSISGTDLIVDITSVSPLVHSEVYKIDVAEWIVFNADNNHNTAIVGDTDWKFTVDGAAPSVSSITLNPAVTVNANNGTTASTVSYIVEFSEDVVPGTVTTSDFTPAGSASGGTEIVSNVTGTGNTYTVTVNNISGLGDLRLDFAGNVDDIVGNSSTTTYNSGESFFIIKPEPSEQPTAFSASPVTDNYTLEASWTAGGGAELSDGYLIFVIGPTGTFPADPTDLTPVANDSDLSDDLLVINSATIPINVTGLNSGTQYDFKIYPYTNSGNQIDYKTNETVLSGSATTTAGQTSTLTFTSASTTISSIVNTRGVSITNFAFTITDDGLTPAIDNSPTRISQIIIKPSVDNDINWSEVIEGIEFNDGTNELNSDLNSGDILITDTEITISNIPNTTGTLGEITDNDIKTYSLKVWLKNNIADAILKDNIDALHLVFNIESSGFTFEEGSSTMAALQSASSGSTNNEVDVVATAFNILQQPPSNITAGKDMAPVVQFEAIDANGNRDHDYAQTPEITNASGFSMSATSVIDISNGVLDFPADFKFTDAPGDGTLTITDPVTPTITIATSAVDVNSSLIFTQNLNGIASDPLTSGALNQALLGFEVNAVGSSTITAINIGTNSSVLVGKIKNVRLIESLNDSYLEADDAGNVIGTFNILTDPITLSGLSENLDNLSPQKFYFVIADVEENVNAIVTSDIQLTLTDVGVSSGADSDIDPFTINSTSYSFTDNIKPDATGAVADISIVSDIDNGNLLTVTIDFNEEMDAAIHPAIKFLTPGEDPTAGGTLTQDNASSNWLDGDTYEAKFLVADNDLEMLDIDLTVSDAQDISGNSMNTISYNDVIDVDMGNPTASTATANSGNPDDATLIVDATTGPGTFTLTITFPEDMIDDGSADPIISFPVEDPTATLTTTPVGSWTDAHTFVATYDVSDGGETLNDIDVRVTGGKDAAGNTMSQSDFLNIFSIDNENATITFIQYIIETISDSETDVPGDFAIRVLFDEPMNTTINPVFTFPNEDPSNTIISINNQYWDENYFYIYYNTSDVNETILDIDVRVESAVDANGNIQNAFDEPDFFNIDTENPTVTAVTPSLTTISDVDAGAGIFTLTIDFSEDMISDGTIVPVIDFPVASEIPTNTINFNSGFWNSPTQYVATYDVTDVNETILNIDVDVDGAQDVVGNAQVPSTAFDNVFSIDMTNPEVVSVTPSTTTINGAPANVINDAVTGTETFTVTVVFDEDMDQTVGLGASILSFPTTGENPELNTISFVDGEWTDAVTYVATYDVADAGELIENIDVQVSGALDVIGNILIVATATDNFTVHMDNPTVLNVTPMSSLGTTTIVGDPIEGSQTFWIEVEFSEPMVKDGSADPTIDFPNEDPNPNSPSNNITENGSSWNIDGTIFTVYYDVNGSFDEMINDIDVRVRFAEDYTANNTVIDSITPDVFTINTNNPSIQNITATNADGFYNEGDVINIQVIFDQDVTVNTTGGTPTLALNTGANAVFNNNSDPNVLEFHYTVSAGENTADLAYTGAVALSLNGATIKDIASNDALIDLPIPGDPSSLSSNKDLRIDTDIPELISGTPFSPGNDAHNVPLGNTFTIDFDEEVMGGGLGGLIRIIDFVNGNELVTINPDVEFGTDPFAATSQVSFSIPGLTESTEFYITIDDGAIVDRAGNNYAGFADDATWFFTTFGAPVITSVDDTTPCIGQDIVLSGQYFIGVNEVRINGSTGALVTEFTVNNDNQITLRIPSDAINGPIYLKKEVGQVNPAGTFANEDTRDYTTGQSINIGPGSALLSLTGNENICNTGTPDIAASSIKVDITGGNGTYDLLFTDGNTTYTRTGYVSGNNIEVPVTDVGDLEIEPSTNDFELIYVRDANSCYVVGSEDGSSNPLGKAVDADFPNSISGTATIKVYAQSFVDPGPDQEFCLLAGDQIQLNGSITGSVTTGIWTADGNGTFDDDNAMDAIYTATLNDAVKGFVTFTLTSDPPGGDNPCTPVQQEVLVEFTSNSIARAGTDQELCESDTDVILNGTVGGGASEGMWSNLSTATVKGTFENAQTNLSNTYIPSQEEIDAGQVTLRLETTNSACGGNVSDDVTIFFSANPTLSAVSTGDNNPTDVCSGEENVYFNVSGSNLSTNPYVWNVPSDKANLITGNGSNSVVVSFKEFASSTNTTISVYDNRKGARCHSDTVEFNVNILKVPQPTFNPLINFNLGLTASPEQLSGSPSPGIFTGNGVIKTGATHNFPNTYFFDPARAGAGIHNVTYSVSNFLGCSADSTRQFNVIDVTASIQNLDLNNQLSSEFCEYNEAINIGLDNSAKVFFTNENIRFSRFILVDANNNEVAEAIENTPGTDALNIDATGLFDPVIASDNGRAAGIKVIRIMVLNSDDDEVIFGSQQITIYPRPVLDINDINLRYCSNEDAVELIRNTSINNLNTFNFYIENDTTNLIEYDADDEVHRFYPGNVPFDDGDYTARNVDIIYNYTDANSCENTLITNIDVFQQPETPVVADLNICQDDNIPAFEVTNAIDGAIFRWNNANGQAITGQSSPTFVPTTNNTVVATTNFGVIQTINSCPSPTKNITLDVLQRPVATLSLSDNTLCIDATQAAITISPAFTTEYDSIESEFTGDINGIVNTEGVFSFDPVLGWGDTDPSQTSLSQIVSYSYAIIHTIEGGSQLACSDDAEQTIVINQLPNVNIISSTPEICEGSGPVNLDGNFDNSGGTFSNTDGAIFGTGVNQTFNPASVDAGEDHLVTYSYTDPSTQCTNIDETIITVNKLPDVGFTVSTVCAGQEIIFTDTTSNNFSSTWEFFNAAGTLPESTASSTTAVYSYETAGSTRRVDLTVASGEGCSKTLTKSVFINPIPTVEFDYEYIVVNSPTEFYTDEEGDFNIPLTDINTLEWNYNGSIETVSENFAGLFQHTFTTEGFKNISLTINSNAGCSSTYYDTLFIVPTAVINATNPSKLYDFENDSEGWTAVASSEDASIRNALWELGTPAGTRINTTNNTTTGSNVYAWMTGLNGGILAPALEGFIYSPAIDFSAVERPMISFDLNLATDNLDDQDNGLVIQYSLGGQIDEDAWITLGDIGEGDNWYNAQRLDAQPGGEEFVGWSGNSAELYSDNNNGWITARRDLGSIAPEDRSKVIFRFAFATDQGADNDGAAIDNFFIGERTRTVLLEHFTNTNSLSNTTNRLDQTGFNQFMSSDDGVEVVKVTYHTAFPGQDLINQDNPGDVGSRVLYYNINSVATTVMDGNDNTYFNSLNDSSGTYTPFASWVSNTFTKRTLKAAKVDIQLEPEDVEIVGATVEIKPTIVPSIAINEDVIVHIAIVEKDISLSSDLSLNNIPADVDKSHYVLKKLLPNPQGTRFTPQINVPFAIENIRWLPENNKIYDLSDLAVVVFVQGASSREILQATKVDLDASAIDITGTEDIIINDAVTLYPVPASYSVTLSYSKGWTEDQSVTVYDMNGKLLMLGRWNSGEKEMEIKTSSLPDGFYFVQVEDPKKGIQVRKKFLVIHK